MKVHLINLSTVSKKLLLFGLPIIIVYFLYIWFSASSLTNTSHEVILHIYLPQFEHVMMALSILIIGSILFDITEKELEQKK